MEAVDVHKCDDMSLKSRHLCKNFPLLVDCAMQISWWVLGWCIEIFDK